MAIWSPNVEVADGVNVNNFPATQPVSATDLDIRNLTSGSDSVTAVGPLTDAELRATPVPVSVSGTVATTVGGTGLATVTSVSVSTTVATLSASNSAKTKVIIHNETGALFVKLGSGASSSSYSYRLTANTVLEITGYYGIVTATKLTGTSNALVTEVGI